MTQTAGLLSQNWLGQVFVSPPFGVEGGQSMQAQFFRKAMLEHAKSNATEVLLLLKAAVGDHWFAAVFHMLF